LGCKVIHYEKPVRADTGQFGRKNCKKGKRAKSKRTLHAKKEMRPGFHEIKKRNGQRETRKPDLLIGGCGKKKNKKFARKTDKKIVLRVIKRRGEHGGGGQKYTHVWTKQRRLT